MVESVNQSLWVAVLYPHVPSVRQYIEIFATRFCLAFPSLTLGTPDFMNSLLNPNMRNNVSASYLLIAGHCMIHANPLESSLGKGTAYSVDGERNRLKKAVFDAMVGFCTSNTVHARCIAQWYVRELFNDPLFKPFIPEGFHGLINFFTNCKDSCKIFDKYTKTIE